MPFTMEDFEREVRQKALSKMKPKEILEYVPVEALLESLPVEKRLEALTEEDLKAYLKKLKENPPKSDSK